MKRLFLFTTLLLFGLYLQAQEQCTDIVQPTEYRESILNCCIKDVKPGNIVVYSKNNIIFETEAVAITYRGEYIYLINYEGTLVNKIREDNYQGNLYHGHNDVYYQRSIENANNKIVLGTVFSITGIGMLVGGSIIVKNNFEKWEGEDPTDRDSYGNGAGIALLLAGAAGCAGGTLLIITGINKKKASIKALDEFNKINLTLGITNDGVGLVLRF